MMLMPSTSLSATLRSTVFAASLTVSVADFRAAMLVENCRGACTRVAREVRARRREMVSERNDMMMNYISGVAQCLFWGFGDDLEVNWFEDFAFGLQFVWKRRE